MGSGVTPGPVVVPAVDLLFMSQVYLCMMISNVSHVLLLAGEDKGLWTKEMKLSDGTSACCVHLLLSVRSIVIISSSHTRLGSS